MLNIQRIDIDSNCSRIIALKSPVCFFNILNTLCLSINDESLSLIDFIMFLFLAKIQNPPKNPQLQQVKILHSYNILLILIYRLTARLGISCRTEMLIPKISNLISYNIVCLLFCSFLSERQNDLHFCEKGTLQKGECTCILHRSFGYLQ